MGIKVCLILFISFCLKKTSVANPDLVSGAFLTPGSGIRDGKKSGSGMEKNPDPGSGMNIPDHFSESLETVFRAKNTSLMRIRDPELF
jgi:hypothetical protein